MKDVYIIGEEGQAHEGSVSMAHSYIDALATVGVDAVKFQMHIADAESSIYETFRTRQPYSDATRMEYWRRMEFSLTEWQELKMHCKSRKMDFIVSPSSMSAVNMLRTVGVSAIKIGSGEVGNILLLSSVSDSFSNIIVSSGMSSGHEIEKALKYLIRKKNKVSLLQCTTAYPASPEEWGLNVIQDFKDRFEIPIGFSDHSGDIYASLAAVSLGAQLIEFHVVYDKRMPGVDTSSSLTIDQAYQLVNGIRQIERAIRNPVNKDDHAKFENLRFLFGKSLAVNKKLRKGHTLTASDLETKKPHGCGIPVKAYEQYLGKQLIRDVEKWEFITKDFF